ncbi:MAG TPA: hypothetical protein ENN51_06770 [candidate division WOR-3 bacterium]|uniref:FlgD/Vpr Ig-like domain-containing protein n=1 Tax=candidate division WOR-3 bacterium TaxID=2052148 RepID=A0A7V0XFE4_UNCW3|nr:hypothetical protein [candidate division WOR-3 bacterium]
MRIVTSVLLAAAVAAAGVIVVPDDYPTIQAGLNAAAYGDTVLVMPGTYPENITWPARDGIRLYSAEGPAATVIDGGGNGRVMDIAGNSIREATELRGFTITGGRMEGSSGSGAGIRVSDANPVITGNIIRGNENVTDSGQTSGRNYGGGLYIRNDASGRATEVRFNVIDSNRQVDGAWNYGAGVYVTGAGGAVLRQNVIRGNVNESEHNPSNRGHGAGVYIADGALLFSNLIVGNVNRTNAWNYGAGVACTGTRAELYANTIVANACQGGTWRYGGGVFVYLNTAAAVKNNIIVGNAAGQGGGLYRFDHASALLDNSHNDVWNNTGGNYANCSPGPGCISEDPLFAAGPMGGYYLSQVAAGQPDNSPCVDAGDTIITAWPVNLDSMLLAWTTRTDSVMDAPPIDIGYHYPVGVMTGVAEMPSFVCRPVRVTPNPSTGSVRFSLPGTGGPVRLAIHDAAGRLVRVLTGVGPLEWDGRDAAGRKVAAGVYPWRVEGGGNITSGRLLRL